MENAAKALLISGGILIAMLIISIAVFLFSNYSDIGNSYDKKTQAIEIQKFNTKFTAFEGRKDITIQEIVSLINFVEQYQNETGIETEVCISNRRLKNEDIIELIQENSIDEENETIKFFKCKL